MDSDEALLKPPEMVPEAEAEAAAAAAGGGPEDDLADMEHRPRQKISHTNSLPGSQPLSPCTAEAGVSAAASIKAKHQSFRIKRPKDEQSPSRTGSSRWSFGGVAKAVGSGVTAFGSGVVQGTRAVGSGVVTGTKAVGSGVLEGTKAVGSGVVEGTKAVGSGAKMVGTGVIEGTRAVGSGVVEGTKVVASVSKDVTLAAGSKVVQAGDIAMSSVSAVGEATVSAAEAVKHAVNESLGSEGEIHVVLPDEDIASLSTKYGVSKRDLIRVNSLNRRSLRAGQELIIPAGELGDDVVHPNEILILKANNEHDQEGVIRLTLENVIWSESGEEKYTISMENVKVIRVDFANDNLPELMPATEAANNGRVSEVIVDKAEDPPKKVEVVELGEQEEAHSSPEDDESSSVRVDFTLFCNDGILAEDDEDEDEDSSSSSDKDTSKLQQQLQEDQKTHTKSFLFEREHLLPLVSYLELWHLELLETSPRLNSIVARQKELCSTSAFTTFSPQDLAMPILGEDANSDILEDIHLQQLFANLPAKIQTQPWTLSYSTHVNGFSLRNLYRNISGNSIDDTAVLRHQSSVSSTSGAKDEDPGSCLIIIQSTEGRIFGSFLTVSPGVTESFVGTGKSWLFAFGGRRGQKLRIYKWSGLNEHFFRGTSDNIIIGADEGRFGLLIDGDLHKGRVQECATFQGWPLLELEEDFVISCLEVWTFES